MPRTSVLLVLCFTSQAYSISLNVRASVRVDGISSGALRWPPSAGQFDVPGMRAESGSQWLIGRVPRRSKAPAIPSLELWETECSAGNCSIRQQSSWNASSWGNATVVSSPVAANMTHVAWIAREGWSLVADVDAILSGTTDAGVWISQRWIVDGEPVQGLTPDVILPPLVVQDTTSNTTLALLVASLERSSSGCSALLKRVDVDGAQPFTWSASLGSVDGPHCANHIVVSSIAYAPGDSSGWAAVVSLQHESGLVESRLVVGDVEDGSIRATWSPPGISSGASIRMSPPWLPASSAGLGCVVIAVTPSGVASTVPYMFGACVTINDSVIDTISQSQAVEVAPDSPCLADSGLEYAASAPVGAEASLGLVLVSQDTCGTVMTFDPPLGTHGTGGQLRWVLRAGVHSQTAHPAIAAPYPLSQPSKSSVAFLAGTLLRRKEGQPTIWAMTLTQVLDDTSRGSGPRLIPWDDSDPPIASVSLDSAPAVRPEYRTIQSSWVPTGEDSPGSGKGLTIASGTEDDVCSTRISLVSWSRVSPRACALPPPSGNTTASDECLFCTANTACGWCGGHPDPASWGALPPCFPAEQRWDNRSAFPFTCPESPSLAAAQSGNEAPALRSAPSYGGPPADGWLNGPFAPLFCGGDAPTPSASPASPSLAPRREQPSKGITKGIIISLLALGGTVILIAVIVAGIRYKQQRGMLVQEAERVQGGLLRNGDNHVAVGS